MKSREKKSRVFSLVVKCILGLVILGLGPRSSQLPTITTHPITVSFFTPHYQIAGIGVGRKGMSEAVLADRTRRIIEVQTFGILRNVGAVAGAERITGPELQTLFNKAAQQNGLSKEAKETLEGVCFVESGGISNAQSDSGPLGNMQFTQDTGRRAGLHIQYATRHKVVFAYRRVGKRKIRLPKVVSYRVRIVDERLDPEKSILAAASYIEKLKRRYGREDLALFAYHSGEGCVDRLLPLADGAFSGPITMPKLYFLNHPGYNRAIYEEIQNRMDKDWGPTYAFRVARAKELLSLYRSDRSGFKKLASAYRAHVNVKGDVPNRLWVWMSEADLRYKTFRDLDSTHGGGKGLARLFDYPKFFGFKLRKSGPHPIAEKDLQNQETYTQNTPAANGLLFYISFETHRLARAVYPNKKFVPLDVSSLVRHLEYQEDLKGINVNARTKFPTHSTGECFDCSHLYLSRYERECLRFILDDLKDYGDLSFMEEVKGSNTFHIGGSPDSRDFFAQVFDEAVTVHVARVAAAEAEARKKLARK